MALQWLSPAVLNSCATYPAHDSKFGSTLSIPSLGPEIWCGTNFRPARNLCVLWDLQRNSRS